jgi:hypothetical protein
MSKTKSEGTLHDATLPTPESVETEDEGVEADQQEDGLNNDKQINLVIK